jgi:glycosyltransferase involved in cell wall biosynthesis
MEEQPQSGISVIICCYNSSNRLPQTLRHLALQDVPSDVNWEIILIDNASTDGTAAVAEREWTQYGLNEVRFNVLSEPKPGKNFAFNTGIEAAKFEYVLTCDDDNWLNSNYIALAFQIMEGEALIGVLGGCGIFEPEYPLNPEIEQLSHYFVNGPQTWASTEHWVYGAGSVYRKSILTDLIRQGWKQITTGRKGKSLVCGEDVEICFMFYLSGYKIATNNNLQFRHFVPLKRQKIKYIIDLTFWLSYSHVLMNSYYPILNDDKRPIGEIINKWLWGATKSHLKNLVRFALKKIKVWEKPSLEERLAFSRIHGTWYALLMNRKRIIDHHKQTKALILSNTHAQ